MTVNTENLDLLALMPCSVKAPMEEELSRRIREIAEKYGQELRFKIMSNAVKQERFFETLAFSTRPEELPNIMLAPGISRFFYKDFMRRFRDTGCFESVCAEELSSAYEELGIADPAGCYDIIGFNPLIMLVDRTRDPDLSVPGSWGDLLRPEYRRRVAFRGHTTKHFCESVLFAYHKLFGKESLYRLGMSVKCCLHPAEMVKLAGTGRPDAPDVSVLPLSFAKFVRETEKVRLVWPKEGALVNPVVMLVKKDSPPAVREIGRMIAGPELGTFLQDAGFYSVCKHAESPLSGERKYYWLGWDFLLQTDLFALLEELNGIMCSTAQAAEEKEDRL
jgi:ABC-type Fe3+ transport system substrate-binding protein